MTKIMITVEIYKIYKGHTITQEIRQFYSVRLYLDFYAKNCRKIEKGIESKVIKVYTMQGSNYFEPHADFILNN